MIGPEADRNGSGAVDSDGLPTADTAVVETGEPQSSVAQDTGGVAGPDLVPDDGPGEPSVIDASEAPERASADDGGDSASDTPGGGLDASAGDGGGRVADEGPTQLPLALAGLIEDPAQLSAAVEAILFVVEAPVTVAALAVALHRTTIDIEQALDRLGAVHAARQAGIELRRVAGGVRLFTRSDLAEVVEHFLHEGQRTKLTQAALETLAVIAYRQPVTRARVSAIRGVNVDGVVRTLLTRGLIIEVGTEPETGGSLFRTTELFLERMGLDTLTPAAVPGAAAARHRPDRQSRGRCLTTRASDCRRFWRPPASAPGARARS